MRNGPGDTIELSAGERHVLALIEAGYERREIAHEMDINPHRVREMVREMCAAYDCSMFELPDVVREAEADWRCMCGTVNAAASPTCNCGRLRQERGEHY